MTIDERLKEVERLADDWSLLGDEERDDDVWPWTEGYDVRASAGRFRRVVGD